MLYKAVPKLDILITKSTFCDDKMCCRLSHMLLKIILLEVNISFRSLGGEGLATNTNRLPCICKKEADFKI